jgi:hypothetical protein
MSNTNIIQTLENCFESSDIIDMVFEFNEKIIGLGDVPIAPLTQKQYDWTQKFCREELDEFQEAFEAQDVVGMVDAVWDLIYGAMGTLKKLGLTRHQARAAFAAIHLANMTKKKGVTHRGSDEDAAKPADFVPPEEVIGMILFGEEPQV